MRPSIRSAVLILSIAAGVPAAGIAFHNHLKKSIPAADEALAASPQEIRLWFAEKPETRFSNISLLKADSSKIAIDSVKATDDSLSVVAAVPAKLGAGKYLVRWRTAGTDGHAVRGIYAFSVK